MVLDILESSWSWKTCSCSRTLVLEHIPTLVLFTKVLNFLWEHLEILGQVSAASEDRSSASCPCSRPSSRGAGCFHCPESAGPEAAWKGRVAFHEGVYMIWTSDNIKWGKWWRNWCLGSFSMFFHLFIRLPSALQVFEVDKVLIPLWTVLVFPKLGKQKKVLFAFSDPWFGKQIVFFLWLLTIHSTLHTGILTSSLCFLQ